MTPQQWLWVKSLKEQYMPELVMVIIYYSGLMLATASADNQGTTQNFLAAPAPVFSRQPVKLVCHVSLPLLLFSNSYGA